MGVHCSLGLVITFLFLATLTAVVSFFVTEWGEFTLGGKYGLWRECAESLRFQLFAKDCRWLYNFERFGVYRGSIPAWFIACQIMFTISVAVLVVNLCILMPFYSCTCGKGGDCFRCIGVVIYSSLLCTVLVMGISLLIFGLEIHLNKYSQALRMGTMRRTLGWAYWMMVCSWVFTVSSVATMFVTHKRITNVEEE